MDDIANSIPDDVRSLLIVLLLVIYAIWLLAGMVDYLCHRWTDIGGTSGSTESWLHVAQFAALGVALLLTTLLAITPLVFVLILTAVVGHSVLSYIDVSYTQPRRHISPLEQHTHGFLDVLPLIAACLVGVVNWHEVSVGSWSVHSRDPPLRVWPSVLLLGSFLLLAGVPIFEELWRTLRWPRSPTSEGSSAPSPGTRR